MGSKFIYTTLLIGCIAASALAQCPSVEPEFIVVHEQNQNGRDGEIHAVFKGFEERLDPNTSNYNFHLWDGDLQAFVYNANKLDPGFYENKDITLSFLPPHTIVFKNVPPSGSYQVVITGPKCRHTYQPQNITVKAYKK